MIQFRGGPRPRNYLARREQVRLFVLVMFLLGAVWVAVEARNSQHYAWIWGWGAGDPTAPEEVDTRLAPQVSPAGDTFVFPPPGERSDEQGQTVTGSLTEADLATVCDDKPFQAGEQGAWFKLFDQLRKTDSATLSEQSIGPVTFIQLYRQPKEYRAELVTIAGTLRRSEQIGAPRNDLGIESYYRTWLFPMDNPADPIVVYTLTVPGGFPQGMTIEESVELDGFFFKRWPYAAKDTVRSAPVVLTKSLRWVVTKPTESSAPMSPASIMAIAAAVAIALVTLVWWRTRRTRADEPISDLFEGASSDDATGRASPLRLLTDPECGDEN